MGSYFYSTKTNGFYHLSLKLIYEASIAGWPKDAMPLSDELYQELIDGQSRGKCIVSDNEGNPMLTQPPEPSQEQKSSIIKDKLNALLAHATVKIGPLQDAVDLGMATDEEKAQLVRWRKYRVLLNRVDTSGATDIDWPKEPEDVA